MAPITAPTNSVCRSGLAENCANELFDSGFRNHAATVKRITNCGELHRIGDVVIGSHLQQCTGHRVGCFCQAALSFCTDLRCASTVLGTHVCTVDCGAFASVAVFSMRFTAMCAHFGFRVFPPRFTPLDHRFG